MGSRWSQGKNEVLALADEIRGRLKTQSVLQIHKDLTADGRVSVSREIFARNIKKYIKSAEGKPSAAGLSRPSSPLNHSSLKKSIKPVPTPVARSAVSPSPLPAEDPLDRRVARDVDADWS